MKAVTLSIALLGSYTAIAQSTSVTAIEHILHATNAALVVVDVPSGAVVARFGPQDVTAAPGSTLKPFILKAALDGHIVDEHSTIHCDGQLSIDGHNLACVHPRDITVLDARQALAESCNSYFAAVAERMNPSVLLNGLRAYGLQPLAAAPTPVERALVALGLRDIRVSPRQMAMAYRKLALDIGADKDGSTRVVRDGLLQSVETGVAHAAHVNGLTIAGKTGTVDDAGPSRSHGWFAGILFKGGGENAAARQVVVIYLPGGNGNDAASLARRYLAGEQRAGK